MPSNSRQSKGVISVLRRTWDDPRLRYPVIYFFLVLAVGTPFFALAEGWRWLDALYFCISTVTMLGYGDVAPQTDLGKVGTMIYAVTGIAIFLRLMERLVLRRPPTSEGNDVEHATDL